MEGRENQGPEGQAQPAVEEVTQDERMWAMFCHLASFSSIIGIPFGNILGPLIVWLIKKEQYPLVDDQGKESLNFQISMTIYAIPVLIISCFLFVPIFALAIFAIVFVIIAAVRANGGERYRYPLTIRLIS